MAFKSKLKNRNPINQTRTIDAIHQDIISGFEKNKKNLQNFYKQSEILENEISKLKVKVNKNKNIIETLELQKKIWSLENKLEKNNKVIYNIEHNQDEKEYLMNTGSILNEYYKDKSRDNDDNEPNNGGNYQSSNNKSKSSRTSSNKNNIMDWFNNSQTNEENTSKSSSLFSQKLTNTDTDTENNSNNKNNSFNERRHPRKKNKNKYDLLSKKELYQKYMKEIDKNYVDGLECTEVAYDVCSYCNIDMLLNTNTSLLICSQCGLQEPIILDIDKPSYKDPPKEMTSFCYKRINHLNEFLAQFQAKETTDIPDELYNEILLEIKKERITNMTQINCDKMRLILKKIKRNEYYEHVPYIINQLNGLPPPIISPEVEEIIRNMFKQIQTPFETLRPDIIPKRKNFLSYNYIMYKFFELLELDEYLDCFQLLKSRNKLYQQDIIWKHICAELNWQYIPSL